VTASSISASAVNVSGALSVAGASSLTGGLVTSSLTATGNAVVRGNLTVSGTSTFGGASSFVFPTTFAGPVTSPAYNLNTGTNYSSGFNTVGGVGAAGVASQPVTDNAVVFSPTSAGFQLLVPGTYILQIGVQIVATGTAGDTITFNSFRVGYGNNVTPNALIQFTSIGQPQLVVGTTQTYPSVNAVFLAFVSPSSLSYGPAFITDFVAPQGAAMTATMSTLFMRVG